MNKTQIDGVENFIRQISKSAGFLGALNSDTDFEETYVPKLGDMNKEKKVMKGRADDFEPNLGKIMDTLDQDYKVLFEQDLDYSIYIQDIEVTDPSGIAFQGLKVYQSVFALLRWCSATIFSKNELKYKISYDAWDQVV